MNKPFAKSQVVSLSEWMVVCLSHLLVVHWVALEEEMVAVDCFQAARCIADHCGQCAQRHKDCWEAASKDQREVLAAAQTSQILKCVLSCFTHGCVSVPRVVHYGLCTRAAGRARCRESQSVSHNNITGWTHADNTHVVKSLPLM